MELAVLRVLGPFLSLFLLLGCLPGPETVPWPRADSRGMLAPPASTVASTPPPAVVPGLSPQALGFPSPSDALSSMEEAMAGIGSWRMEMEVLYRVAGDAGFGLTLAGEVEGPSRQLFDMDVVFLEEPFFQAQFLAYDGVGYLRNGWDGPWHVDSGSGSIGGGISHLRGDAFLAEGVLGMKVLGEMDQDGVRLYRLSGALSGDAIARVAGEDSPAFGSGTVDYWIGVEDSLLYRSSFELIGEDAGLGTDSFPVIMTLDFRLWDHGAGITVPPPLEVSDEPYPDPFLSTSPSQ